MSISPSRLRSLGLGLAASVVLTAGLVACSSDGSDGSSSGATTTTAAGGATTTEAPKDTTTTTSPGTLPTVSNVWTEPADEGTDTAIYLSITSGATDDALVSVSLSEEWAESAELTEAPVELPATKTVQFVKDGPYIKVTGLKKAFLENKPFELTLEFENSPTQHVEGDVREQSLGES